MSRIQTERVTYIQTDHALIQKTQASGQTCRQHTDRKTDREAETYRETNIHTYRQRLRRQYGHTVIQTGDLLYRQADKQQLKHTHTPGVIKNVDANAEHIGHLVSYLAVNTTPTHIRSP